MKGTEGQILIGTILLDVNRWGTPKTPTYEVSAWLDRFREAGFDGMELWEYHATLCSDEERARLTAADFPATVYNVYCDFDNASAADRDAAAQMAGKTGARGIKYNVGKDPSLRGEYLDNLNAWREALPADCALLCECHPGTIIEEPEAARAFFDDFGDGRSEIIVHPFNAGPEGLRSWLDLFGDQVSHLHIQMRDDGRNVLRLDEQPDRAKETFGILRDAGFNGSTVIEFAKGTREPGENIDDLWAHALADLAFLREHL